jgi:hypothetical protein
MKSNNQIDHYSYLLGGAELNDSLLQSYRSFHLTLQSIFIAIGTGLSVAVLVFDKAIKSLLATLILFVLAIISNYILVKMQKIIIDRGKDVSYWHRNLIKAEQELAPEKRYFTQFKINQRLQRADAKDLQKLFLTKRDINDKEIDLLVEKGLGHTRKILDRWLFNSIRIIWILLCAISLGYIAYLFACR